MTAIDLAYAAGIMDGEGYIGITVPYANSQRCRLVVSVSMTRPETPIWFKEMFNGCLGCYRRDHVKNTYRDIYRWTNAGRAAAHFLMLIKPYVKIKKRQIEIAIEFAATITDRGYPIANEIVDLRFKLMNEIRQENQGKYSPHPRTVFLKNAKP